MVLGFDPHPPCHLLRTRLRPRICQIQTAAGCGRAFAGLGPACRAGGDLDGSRLRPPSSLPFTAHSFTASDMPNSNGCRLWTGLRGTWSCLPGWRRSRWFSASTPILLAIYCALVYGLGYAKFKRLQAVDGPSRDLVLPAGLEAFFVRPLARISARFHTPFATLLKKEFRLQQISFLLAGFFCLIAVAGACLIKHHHDLAEGIIVADCFIFVVILPLIAGTT